METVTCGLEKSLKAVRCTLPDLSHLAVPWRMDVSGMKATILIQMDEGHPSQVGEQKTGRNVNSLEKF